MFWSWEQTLRGLYHGKKSKGPLKRLILIVYTNPCVKCISSRSWYASTCYWKTC